MKFSEYRNEYIKFLNEKKLSTKNIFRLETQIESLKEWTDHTVSDLETWYENLKNEVPMQVKEIPLNDCEKWNFDEGNKAIYHDTKKFFTVIGIEVSLSSNREVGKQGWCQPILKEINYDGGIVGIIRKNINGVPHYLVEAKVEPGNFDLVQISPCLQATFSNIEQAHGGRMPYLLKYFISSDPKEIKILFEQWMSEDGGRLFKKRNKGMIVEISESHELEIEINFRWVTLYQIKELIKKRTCINPHLRSLISHL